jgi:hypothetical protein
MKQFAWGVLTFLLVFAGSVAGFSYESWAGERPAAVAKDKSQSLPWSMGVPVSGDMLDQTRGMGGQTNIDKIASTLDNPTATIFGSNFNNAISTGAFAGASGIVNVIQNAGSNVVIDNSVQVNLSFH